MAGCFSYGNERITYLSSYPAEGRLVQLPRSTVENRLQGADGGRAQQSLRGAKHWFHVRMWSEETTGCSSPLSLMIHGLLMEHPHGASPSLLPRILFDGRVDEYTEGVELQNARSRDSRHGNRIYRKPQAAAKLHPFTFFVYSSFLSGKRGGGGSV
ncbi:hypothetical protein NPIL_144681 [Nephila pilipes]|uniref:Uncharacterized protein n=1 Tax=Nephila pilipes TaxID=299642 RepID=A0A8X6PQM6_NEPPI|nr:hypothetical protein NPIL_144681 [Nephila pilipes]